MKRKNLKMRKVQTSIFLKTKLKKQQIDYLEMKLNH